MFATQIDTAPITIGATVPVDGIKISDLLGNLDGRSPRFVMVERNQPGVSTDRVDLLFTTRRPGAVSVEATDYSAHGVFIPAGFEFSRPFNVMQDGYLKPAGLSAANIVLTVG